LTNSTGLVNLPEEYLYDLVPGAIASLDERGIIEAVISGYQDRLCDMRYYVGHLQGAFDPAQVSPEVADTVVELVYYDGNGKETRRVLDVLADTPTDPLQLEAWAAAQAHVLPSQVISASIGTDALRLVRADMLTYIATTFGARLYPSVGKSQAQRNATLMSYFPRLKIKSTPVSFELIGRFMGFDDVRVAAQWSRLSPRLPEQVHNTINDPDYADQPYFTPAVLPGIHYDPVDYRDGDLFIEYNSPDLSPDPLNLAHYPDAVNAKQPFIQLEVTGDATVVEPTPGEYVLAGGTSATAATAVLSSNLTAKALIVGESFNGLRVIVRCTATNADGSCKTRALSVVDRVSAIKYAASLYNLTSAVSPEHIIEYYCSARAQTNHDLEFNPQLRVATDGVATAPFRPWTGAEPRHQAYPDEQQLPLDTLMADATPLLGYYSDVKPATREPRRLGIGLALTDEVCYAPYVARTALFTSAAAGDYTGSLQAGVDTPTPPYMVSFTAIGADNTEYVVTGEWQNSAQSAMNVTSAEIGLTGSYNLQTSEYAMTIGVAGITLYANWTKLVTEVIGLEPYGAAQKCQPRPEDDVECFGVGAPVINYGVVLPTPTGRSQWLNGLTPTFYWDPVQGAACYIVYVYIGTDVIYISPYLVTSQCTIPAGILNAGVEYGWSVQARVSCGELNCAPGAQCLDCTVTPIEFRVTILEGPYAGVYTLGQVLGCSCVYETRHAAYVVRLEILHVNGLYYRRVNVIDGGVVMINATSGPSTECSGAGSVGSASASGGSASGSI
jgi:hypothetical protein